MTKKIQVVNIEGGEKFTGYTEDDKRFVFGSDLKKNGEIDGRARGKHYRPQWHGRPDDQYKGAAYAQVRPEVEPAADFIRSKIAVLRAQMADLDKSLYNLYVDAEKLPS